MNKNLEDPKVIVALDFSDRKTLNNFVDQVEPSLCKLKVGKELFTSFGPELVKDLIARGYDIFLDLKFHDIPNTVAKACVAAADLGVWMLNVHAQGGKRMLAAAKAALQQQEGQTKLIAVTVLTSMEQSDLNEIGLTLEPQTYALKLATLAYETGLDGVVCSAQEAQSMRKQFGAQFELVTPGIRPRGFDANDQRRIMTPQQAVYHGANYIVIGRPVTQSNDPVSLLLTINSDISDSSA